MAPNPYSHAAPKPESRTLTARDLEFLELYSYGYRYQDIAKKFNVGYWYVRRKFSLLQQKMGADTVAHAVAVALRTGLIK